MRRSRAVALLLKLTLVPLLLWGITIISRVFGPRPAGMLSGIPLVAGPLVAFLAWEQGAAFAARSATTTLGGEAALIGFCIAYALSARWLSWWQCVLVGWAAFLAGVAILNALPLGRGTCIAVGLVAPLVLRFALITPPNPLVAPRALLPWVDLLGRMLAGATLVLALTAAARGLGPKLSGLLTIFPVATAVLAAFSHRAYGPRFSVELMRGIALGLYSFSAFFLVVALFIETIGIGQTLAFGLLASVAVQGVLILVVSKISPRPNRGAGTT